MFKKYFFLLLLSFSFSSSANEAPYHPKDTWWLNLGYGPVWLVSHQATEEGGSNKTGGIIQLSVNYALFDTQFIEFRANQMNHILDLSCINGCGKQINEVDDIGVLYGLMKKEKWYMIGGAIGLAYTNVQYKEGEVVYDSAGGYYTTKTHSSNVATLGVPFEAQFFYTPFKYVGIGLIGLGNLNTEGSMAGLQLALQFGKLRP